MALIKRETLFHQTKLNVLSSWFSLSELPKSIINLQLESHFLSSAEEVSLSRLFSSQRWWLIWVCVRLNLTVKTLKAFVKIWLEGRFEQLDAPRNSSTVGMSLISPQHRLPAG